MAPSLEKPSLKDRQRWYLWKQEKPIEEIAAREKVTVETIRKSIDAIESYRLAGSYEEVDIAWNHLALRLVEDQEGVLRSAMVAEKVTVLPDGARGFVPDHLTRMRALEVAREFAEVTRPKVPMNQMNVQTNVVSGSNGSGGGISFESRLREIKARRAAGELSSGAPLLEASAQPSQAEALAAEFEDVGIDLEEGDLEEMEGDETSA